jgi:hypothetical protein
MEGKLPRQSVQQRELTSQCNGRPLDIPNRVRFSTHQSDGPRLVRRKARHTLQFLEPAAMETKQTSRFTEHNGLGASPLIRLLW